MNITYLLVALGVAGSLSAGAYLYQAYSSSDDRKSEGSISRALLEKKYVILDASRTSEWDSILVKYKAVNPDGAKDVSQLQQECKSLLSKELNDVDYKKARMWCVEGQSVTQKLGLFNRSVLSTNDASHDDKWKVKIDNHKKPIFTNKLSVDLGQEEDKNLTAVKAECTKLNVKTNVDETFEDDLLKAFEWCSEEILGS